MISRELVESWVELLGGATLVLDTPHGTVHCTTSQVAHRRLAAAGEVVLSPLEVLALLQQPDADVAQVVAVKRAFGGDARVLGPAADEAPQRARARRRQRRVKAKVSAKEAKVSAKEAAERPAKAKPRQGVLL